MTNITIGSEKELKEALAFRRKIKKQILENEFFLAEVLDVIEQQYEEFSGATIFDVVHECDGVAPNELSNAIAKLSVYIEFRESLTDPDDEAGNSFIAELKSLLEEAEDFESAIDRVYGIVSDFNLDETINSIKEEVGA